MARYASDWAVSCRDGYASSHHALSQARILGEDFVYVLDPLEDKDWEREWMENFHAMQFGQRLWICPSWREIPDPNAVNVMLIRVLHWYRYPCNHSTLPTMARWTDLVGKTVLDFVVALILGLLQLLGHLIWLELILILWPQATRENALRNQVSERVEAYLPEHAPSQQFDVVLANILAAPLRELKEIIAGYCHSGGQIILSGILVEQAEKLPIYILNFCYWAHCTFW